MMHGNQAIICWNWLPEADQAGRPARALEVYPLRQ